MMSWLLPFLAVLFFLSGASALVYQVLWLRLLGLVFGVTIHAASTVLSSFMAGLACGSYWAGRVADRARRPLALFGIAEILVGASALATPAALDAVSQVYVLARPALADTLPALTTVRFVLAFAVLIGPTFLMGATLPLVIKSSLVRQEGLGTRISLLYGINTAGAIFGTLVAGFYLVPAIGIRTSFLLAAGVNAVVGVTALVATRWVGDAPPRPEASGAPGPRELRSAAAGALPDSTRRLVLAIFVVSGFTSLGLEIVWFRVLVIFMRATSYAFTVMLATILAGLALGSLLVAPVARRRLDWPFLLACLEIAIGITAALSFAALGWSYGTLGLLTPVVASLTAPYLAPLVVASVLAMLPTAVLFGMAFPIGLRLWADGGQQDPSVQTASRIGVFYSLNLWGAIVGSVTTGFVLLPRLGSQMTLVVLASMAFMSGWILLGRVAGTWRRAFTSLAGLIIFAVALLTVPSPFEIALTRLYRGEQPIWRQEGVQTTASVHLRRMGQPTPNRVLYLDGTHQASDHPTTVFVHRRIGFLPMALHPDPRRALVIGLGGGATPGAVSAFPSVHVEVVELSRSVVHGSEWFRHVNFDLLRRPNVTLRVDDGRNHLLASRVQYDVITADILIPRHAGAGNLYSAEYFRLVRRALREGGLVLQWVGPDTDFEYKIITRTFLSVFPDATLWGDGSLLVGSTGPVTFSRTAFARKLEDPETRTVLELMGVDSVDRLVSLFVAGPEELHEFVGPGPILTDNRPLLEYFLSLPRDMQPVDLSGLRGDVGRLFFD